MKRLVGGVWRQYSILVLLKVQSAGTERRLVLYKGTKAQSEKSLAGGVGTHPTGYVAARALALMHTAYSLVRLHPPCLLARLLPALLCNLHVR